MELPDWRNANWTEPTTYPPPFPGYRIVRTAVCIVDALVDLCCWPFKRDSMVVLKFTLFIASLDRARIATLHTVQKETE